MRTATIVRRANEAPPVDACLRFVEGGDEFVGVVDDVARRVDGHVRITLCMTAADHQRLMATRSENLGTAA
jgi:DNA polymerase II small subunit/DNA polymerase delta subunit B